MLADFQLLFILLQLKKAGTERLSLTQSKSLVRNAATAMLNYHQSM